MAYKSKFQGMARTYIPSLIKQGYSGGKALNWLKKQGLGYRKKEFLGDWREFTGREKKKDSVKYIRKDRKPTGATMSITTENMKGQYSYVFEAKGKDPITGKPKTLSWRHTTDKTMTMEDVEAVIKEDIRKEEYEVAIDDMKLIPGEVLSRIRL